MSLNFQYFFYTSRNSHAFFITSVCKKLNYFLLLCFCFKNLDLLDLHTTQFDFSLSTLFVIFTTCDLKLWVKSLHPKQYVVPSSFPVFNGFIFDFMHFHIFNVKSIFLTKYLMCFNGIECLTRNSIMLLQTCSFVLSFCFLVFLFCLLVFLFFHRLIEWCNSVFY